MQVEIPQFYWNAEPYKLMVTNVIKFLCISSIVKGKIGSAALFNNSPCVGSCGVSAGFSSDSPSTLSSVFRCFGILQSFTLQKCMYRIIRVLTSWLLVFLEYPPFFWFLDLFWVLILVWLLRKMFRIAGKLKKIAQWHLYTLIGNIISDWVSFSMYR